MMLDDPVFRLIIDEILKYHRSKCSDMFLPSDDGFKVNTIAFYKAEACRDILKRVVGAFPEAHREHAQQALDKKIKNMFGTIFFTKEMADSHSTTGNREGHLQ